MCKEFRHRVAPFQVEIAFFQFVTEKHRRSRLQKSPTLRRAEPLDFEVQPRLGESIAERPRAKDHDTRAWLSAAGSS
jgi:hypothetical protein